MDKKYPMCQNLSKQQLQGPINEELRTKLTRDFRVLPLYEKMIFNHNFSRSHSLETNEFLHCRWLEYQKLYFTKKREPFNFPRISDQHFYNNTACYKPELSISSRADYRYSLKNGPGVDAHGEMPIPSDIGFRKTGLMVDRKNIKKRKHKKIR